MCTIAEQPWMVCFMAATLWQPDKCLRWMGMETAHSVYCSQQLWSTVGTPGHPSVGWLLVTDSRIRMIHSFQKHSIHWMLPAYREVGPVLLLSDRMFSIRTSSRYTVQQCQSICDHAAAKRETGSLLATTRYQKTTVAAGEWISTYVRCNKMHSWNDYKHCCILFFLARILTWRLGRKRANKIIFIPPSAFFLSFIPYDSGEEASNVAREPYLLNNRLNNASILVTDAKVVTSTFGHTNFPP